MPTDRLRPARTLLPLLASLSLVSCGNQGATDPHSASEGEPVRILWRTPQPGAELSDTLRAEVVVEGTVEHSVSLFAGDSLVSTRVRPPWRYRWLPAGSAPRRISLHVVLDLGFESELVGPQLRVDWSGNEAPRLRREGVDPPTAIARSDTVWLSVLASDPEDGLLDGESIRWSSDLQGLLGFGRTIPSSGLRIGVHRIGVRATDRWGRSQQLEFEIEAFDFRGGLTPDGLLFDLEHALRARSPEIYLAGLAPSFRFLFCPAERARDRSLPCCIDLGDERLFIESILGDGRYRLERMRWTVASIQDATADGRGRRKVEIDDLSLELSSTSGDPLRVTGARARLYLVWSEESERWLLEQWNDLGSASELSQGGLRRLLLETDVRRTRSRSPRRTQGPA